MPTCTSVRCSAFKQLAFALAGCLLAPLVVAVDQPAPADDYAVCAAYFFNATKARPMGEYEALYSAGEIAVNRASQSIDSARIDRLMGDASLEMTALMDSDWHHFDRVAERYADRCNQLIQAAESNIGP